MSGHDPLSLAEWQRVRRYAVPERMIAECAEARSRGDWRAACAAGRIDVRDNLSGNLNDNLNENLSDNVGDLVVHLAPDLLRWHLPRALGGDTTLAVGVRYVLVPGDTVIGADTVVLAVDAPLSVYGSQRLTLEAVPWGDLQVNQVVPVPAYLWDVRYAGDLRAAVGGPASPAGAGAGFADAAEPPFAAGFVVDVVPPADWADLRSVDTVRLAYDVRLLARQFGLGTWTLWFDHGRHLRLDLDGDAIRVAWRATHGGLPRISPELVRYQVDLDLVRTGRLTPGEVHPLVRAALFPDAEPVAASPAALAVPSAFVSLDGPGASASPVALAVPSAFVSPDGSAASASPVALAVPSAFVSPDGSAASASPVALAVPPALASPDGLAAPASPVGAAGLLSPDDFVALAWPGGSAVLALPVEPVRVRCRGDWHRIGVRLGRLELLSHTESERQRERALSAFGGSVTGCFAVEQSWHGAPGRLPRRMRAHREDLWQRMIHGGTRTVFELLDAGMNPQLRDSRGRTLMHRVRSFDHPRLLPRLLADGLDVNARDKEGSTPLYLAVVHRWPAGLIVALSDAGADPHLPNQGGMSVLEHFEEILDYHEDLAPDFEAAVAYLRKHAL
ncbi:hypothetical protein [Actinoplanes subglobosus]|uniref:Ankyrin n=1 Tax=Actinoplanes subglobosus TaxID=1547892 RepID=A0ABV8IX99_9ACTN